MVGYILCYTLKPEACISHINTGVYMLKPRATNITYFLLCVLSVGTICAALSSNGVYS